MEEGKEKKVGGVERKKEKNEIKCTCIFLHYVLIKYVHIKLLILSRTT